MPKINSTFLQKEIKVQKFNNMTFKMYIISLKIYKSHKETEKSDPLLNISEKRSSFTQTLPENIKSETLEASKTETESQTKSLQENCRPISA